jgi:4'-phosphopantetheinyl transferase
VGAETQPDAPASGLSEDELARAGRFLRQIDGQRFRASRAHLRRLLASYLSCRADRVTFLRAATGKPELTPECGLNFSVSHSENVLLVGIGVVPVGVDVECVRPIPHLEAVAALTLTPPELDGFAEAPPDERLTRFYRLWTAKEAVLKGLGVGLSRDPREVELRPTVGGFVVRRSPEPAHGWHVVSLDVAVPSARCAVVAAAAMCDSRRSCRP